MARKKHNMNLGSFGLPSPTTFPIPSPATGSSRQSYADAVNRVAGPGLAFTVPEEIWMLPCLLRGMYPL
ncbi:hypothetical protein QJS10_CPA08g01109 [Acorus calamus]|uniref:Uncharacterized protein n=1 Tax=Acorus calamus TaxID=4465 RepID=A0AAV9EAQ9_ACOCL|nr:hypothetical protein QJS10_CPA08g01109 [Acorus calamus]